MKKKLISLAVAAAMAAPAAAMADAILYGKLHMTLDYADVKNAAATPTFNPVTGAKLTNGRDFNGWGMSGDGDYMPGNSGTRGSRIGVRGSEDLGNGLKAIYQIEFGVSLTATNDDVTSGGNTLSMRNSYAGLETGFGSVMMGRMDSPLRSVGADLHLFNDTMADYAETVGMEEDRFSNVLAYVSPNWSGFQVMGALVAPGSATATGATNVNDDAINGGWSLAAIYSNGPFYGAAGYQSLGNEMDMNSATSVAGASACNTLAPPGFTPTCNYVRDDYNVWRLALGIKDWNGFTLGAIYEKQSDRFDAQTWNTVAGRTYYGLTTVGNDGTGNYINPRNSDQDILWIVGAYQFGNNTIKAAWGKLDRNNIDYKTVATFTPPSLASRIMKDYGGDRTTWSVAFDHALSKRTSAYLLYTAVNDDREDFFDSNGTDGRNSTWDGFSLGFIHNF